MSHLKVDDLRSANGETANKRPLTAHNFLFAEIIDERLQVSCERAEFPVPGDFLPINVFNRD
jgi:hypothetical protein